MKRATLALALLGGALAAVSEAQLPEAGIWIGFDGTPDGFWLETGTGETWMTGVCLRQIANSEPLDGQGGLAWISRNRTVETIGRLSVPLDQTFVLSLSGLSEGDAAEILVNNPDRGGEQRFAAVVRRCDGPQSCTDLRSQPSC